MRKNPIPRATPVTAFTSAMSLVELLAVMAIVSILFGLTAVSYRALSDSVEVTNGAQQVIDVLNFARQYATSKNEYVQVRFLTPQNNSDPRKGQYTALSVYRSDAPLYGSNDDYKLRESQGRFLRINPHARLAGSCIVLNSATFSPLLAGLPGSGTETLSDGAYDWVGFYFKPDGSTDLNFADNTQGLSICSNKSYQASPNKLPPSYAVITLDKIVGRYQLLRP